jgi:hypothetical protein
MEGTARTPTRAIASGRADASTTSRTRSADLERRFTEYPTRIERSSESKLLIQSRIGGGEEVSSLQRVFFCFAGNSTKADFETTGMESRGNAAEDGKASSAPAAF